MTNSINYLKAKRRFCVQILYRFFLMKEDIFKIKQEILDGSQFEKQDEEMERQFLLILNQYSFFKESLLILLSKNWTWERLPNIIKAILINSVYEIKNLELNKSIVITEAIEMTREFLPSWDTTFINAILDKINY